MGPDENLLILGASARAAAFSALRAGLRPWCVDLFADADLEARCPATRLRGPYPAAFADVIGSDLRGPWMYTGGLENHPRLIARMARQRQLWGNGPEALVLARDPAQLAIAAHEAGLPAPSLDPLSRSGPWLLKPRAGAGGHGIRMWKGEDGPIPDKCYLQQFIEGPSASAVFVGPTLLGVTRQLVGEEFLHAPRFTYCGSIGPLSIGHSREKRIQTLGEVLVARCKLRGLFGIDGILRDGMFWPIEINPRYTASIEVLEHATDLRAMELHATAFNPDWRAGSVSLTSAFPLEGSRLPLAAKAILYARADLVFPDNGPWRDAPADFADLPHAHDTIEAGTPILTLIARGKEEDSCLAVLRRRAAEVEACLYAGP